MLTINYLKKSKILSYIFGFEILGNTYLHSELSHPPGIHIVGLYSKLYKLYTGKTGGGRGEWGW